MQYELFEDGKEIFYSLGNFIFDTDYHRAHPYTDIGMLLKLIFKEDSFDFEAIGTRINRITERIETVPLPEIFVNVPSEEYELLSPLAAKAFIIDDKRKMIYLEPNRFTTATDEEWGKYFSVQIRTDISNASIWIYLWSFRFQIELMTVSGKRAALRG